MITILFIIAVVLNALMLVGLLYTIKLNLKSEQENPALEKV